MLAVTSISPRACHRESFSSTSISPGLDKHDFARGKVDRGRSAAGEGYASLAVSIPERACQFRPLCPTEPLTLQNVGDRPGFGRRKFAGRVRKVTKVLDNSGRQFAEQWKKLTTNPGPQKSRILVGRIVRMRDAMTGHVGLDVRSPGANERPNEIRGT
jgi:hypothetical protein